MISCPAIVRSFCLAGVLCFVAASAFAQSLNAEVRRVARPVPGRYIVMLRDADDAQAIGAESSALHRGKVQHVYRVLRGFSAALSEDAARELARDPRVAFVQ